MRRFSLWQRGLLVSVCLLGATLVAYPARAAADLRMCDLFSTDEAAQLVGQPIINSTEGAEDTQWVCARYGAHAATLLELKLYQTAQDPNRHGGSEVLGLGDAARLVTSDDGRYAILWVTSGRFVVSMEVNLDEEPTQVTPDDMAPLVQRVLDNLPQPVASSGCNLAAAAAIADYVGHADITGVEIIGGCHYLAIATRLADSSVGTAMDICAKAAEVAYTSPMGAIKSIAVTSNGGRELAIGLINAGCIGEL
jgi:hypothetical protein